MILASLNLPTLSEAVGLGAIYALMALGIGLVFGILRLVNFAYGQLVMAGAYTLAFTSQQGWAVWQCVATCLAVVVALSLLMELVVFRPLRGQSPAVMLVTTFAIAFMLQAIALIVDLQHDNILGEIVFSPIGTLNDTVSIGGVDVRKVTIVAVGVALGALIVLGFILAKTRIGLHTRAAASDFSTARLLGVRANRVITFAVVVSGLLAGGVAVLMVVSQPLVTPDFALHDTIIVLVGVVVGGLDRLWTATLGGFLIGFASGLINGLLHTNATVYLPSVLFGLVILVLLLRPNGLFVWGRRARVERV
jgi:branched-chain amino acid transport system permease protein